MKGMRLVVPPTMRRDLLNHIHASHLGIAKCKRRAREALFWLGMLQEVHQMVSNCPTCDTYQNGQPSETLRPTETPELSWKEIASDLFEWQRAHYTATIDYYSKYIEVEPLRDMSATSSIEALKSQFARHGIPQLIRTGNGPQYSSREFAELCGKYVVQHKTSSFTCIPSVKRGSRACCANREEAVGEVCWQASSTARLTHHTTG